MFFVRKIDILDIVPFLKIGAKFIPLNKRRLIRQAIDKLMKRLFGIKR